MQAQKFSSGAGDTVTETYLVCLASILGIIVATPATKNTDPEIVLEYHSP